MEPMHQRVAGIDVHRMKHVVTILIGREDGAVSSETREFGGFKRDMRALVAWLQTHRIQQVVMESTGIYWKSVFGHLEAAGIPALVVNAFHVKNVPGRKTDVGDSEWLAQLARFGLLRGSFIPPKDLCPVKASMFSRDQACRGKSQTPVVWIAKVKETETLKPIDKVSPGEIHESPSRKKVNAKWPRK